jgi:hypothetical protein
LASQDLFNALSSSTFYSNPSTVTLSQKFGYLNIACEYFEPENVTCQECGWSEGNLPYLYDIYSPSRTCGVRHKQADSLMEQWREYLSEWERMKLSPAKVYKYWEKKSEKWNILGPHAMREFSRPGSPAACERVFSLLEGMNREDRCKIHATTLAKVLFLRGNADIMRSSLKDANARRMQAAQAKAAQEKAASTSEWNASKATNKQPVVDAIEIDDDEPVARGKGRKKRLRRLGEDVNIDEERKKERLEKIAKINELWDALRIKRKKRKREERKRGKKNGKIVEYHNIIICTHTGYLISLFKISEGNPSKMVLFA